MLSFKGYQRSELLVCALVACSFGAFARTALIADEPPAASRPVCPGRGECCNRHRTPGCSDLECCNAICTLNPFCCEESWDSVCAEAAAVSCDSCVVRGDGNCAQSEDCSISPADCPCPDGLICDSGECVECVSDADCIPADSCSPDAECIDQHCIAIGWDFSHQKISDSEGGFTGMLDNKDSFGFSVVAIGDLDGDGVGDLAVGADRDDDGGVGVGANRGAVWILFLNDDGTVKAQQKISDTEGGFTGILDDHDWLGWSVAYIGDLDGDGVADLAVGARGDDDGGSARGAVWMLFLNADGTVKSHQKISDTEGGFTGMLDNVDRFGSSVASIGDLDGDGVADLAVGADQDDDGGHNRGAVWVLFLNSDGTVKSHQKISDTMGGFTGILDDWDRFGRSVASIGDLDGDGVADLAVGAYRDDDGGVDRGAVWVLFLNDDGTVKSHQKISATEGGFTGTLDDVDLFGVSVTFIGDLDADGASDLAVGALFDDDGGIDTGAVWLLFLSADGTVKSHQKISAAECGFNGILNNGGRFGGSVASIGDFDADGARDLAVGAYQDDDGGLDRGAIWLLFPSAGQPPCCDDGVFCNGAESCDSDSGCVSSGDPCEGLIDTPHCDEQLEACAECLHNSDCETGETCTVGSCGGDLTVSLVASDATPSPGDQIVIETLVSNETGSPLEISGFQIEVLCPMAGGDSGSVDAFTSGGGGACTGIAIETLCDPGICLATQVCVPGVLNCEPGVDCLDDEGGVVGHGELGLCEDASICSTVPFVDASRVDYLLGSAGLSFSDFSCNPNIGVSGLLLVGSTTLADQETRYLGTFIYEVSGNASGTFTLDIFMGLVADGFGLVIPDVVLEGATIVVQSVP